MSIQLRGGPTCVGYAKYHSLWVKELQRGDYYKF